MAKIKRETAEKGEAVEIYNILELNEGNNPLACWAKAEIVLLSYSDLTFSTGCENQVCRQDDTGVATNDRTGIQSWSVIGSPGFERPRNSRTRAVG